MSFERSPPRGLGARIQDHPVVSYFALTFAISWGGIVVVIAVARTGVIATQEDFTRLIPIWAPILVLGPSLSALLVTGLADGRPGLQALRSRLSRWRVDPRWYVVALLTGPVCYAAASLALSAESPAFLPAIVTTDDRTALVVRGISVALLAGILEELGWTGFAVPALRRRRGATTTGLIVGVLWGLWHFLPKLFGAAVGQVGALLPVDLGCAVVGLTGFRILMVWVYDRTRSLPVAMLMHTGITASMMILQPLVTGARFAAAVLALAAVPWLVVAAVAAVHHAGAARQGPQGQPVP
jgi:membrane protease YdiL (CAAX protease family)